jgi:hypothetical protein
MAGYGNDDYALEVTPHVGYLAIRHDAASNDAPYIFYNNTTYPSAIDRVETQRFYLQSNGFLSWTQDSAAPRSTFFVCTY